MTRKLQAPSSQLLAPNPRLQLELPYPALLRPVERPNQIHFRHGKAKQVLIRRPAPGAEDRITGTGAKDRRLMTVIPGESGVAEHRELDREGSIVARTDAEHAEEREAELGVADYDSAPQQLVEHGAGIRLTRGRLAFRAVKGAVAVPPHQPRLAKKQRLQTGSSPSLA